MVNVLIWYFGDEILFDLDLEIVEFCLSGIVLDFDCIKEMKDVLIQFVIFEIFEQFRFGVFLGLKFELVIFKNFDVFVNFEKV